MKPKAPPGKRYCKQCPQLLPIHLRVCSHCHAPQYTRQQLDREDRKRKRDQEDSSEDEDHLRQVLCTQRHEAVLSQPNPFASRLPVLSAPGLHSASRYSVSLQIGEVAIELSARQSWVSPDLALINPAGRVRALAWAYRREAPYYLAVGVQEDCQDLEYGRVYAGQGLIQIWRFEDMTPSLAFSLAHTGKCVYDVQWFPAYSQPHLLGTLLYATSAGQIQVLNVPTHLVSGVHWLEPLETFEVAGLVFQSLSWLQQTNRFAAGSQDGSILVFQSGCAEPVVAMWGAHTLPVTALALSYKYNQLSSCSLDGLLKLWDPTDGSLKVTVCSNKRWNYHIAWHPHGDFLFFDNDGVTSPHKVIKVDGEHCVQKKHVSDVSRESTLCTVYSMHSGYAYIAASDGRISAVYLQELAKTLKKRKKPWSRHLKVISLDCTAPNCYKVDLVQRVIEDLSPCTQRLQLSPPAQAITHVDVTARQGDELLSFAVCGGLLGVCCMRLQELS